MDTISYSWPWGSTMALNISIFTGRASASRAAPGQGIAEAILSQHQENSKICEFH